MAPSPNKKVTFRMGAPLLPSVEVLFKQSDPDKQRVSRLFVKLALGKSNTLIGCVTVAVQVVLLVNRTMTVTV